METEFKLYRNKGFLLFNTGDELDCFWVSMQAAQQGGGSMYAQISKQDFEKVWNGNKDVTDFSSLFNRSYNSQKEELVKETYGIDEVIALHLQNLGINPNPVKSCVVKKC